MNKEEILAMNPGEELDALIAREIMELEISHLGTRYLSAMIDPGVWSPPACYSTNISAAWQVVEKMLQMGYKFAVNHVGVDWYCAFWCEPSNKAYAHSDNTAPEAICKAALLSKKG